MSEAKKEALALPPESRSARWVRSIAFLAIGVLLTLIWVYDPIGLRGEGEETSSEESALAAGVYVCPMHPEVIDDHDSGCPICGMPLEQVRDSGEAPTDGSMIFVEPQIVQQIGVVSVAAEMASLKRKLTTVGVLDYNADRIDWINTRYAGWIEAVHVAFVGEEIAAGDPLFDIYSPELVTTQEEYLRATEYKRSLTDTTRVQTQRQADRLLDSTRERLLYLGLSLEQVDQLDRTQEVQRLVTVRSPVDGVITEVFNDSLLGLHVNAGQNLYRIADTSTIWVHADVFESDLGSVREGQQATVTFPFESWRRHKGTVLFFYPEMAAATRTLKVCIELPNPGNKLRAGMYADVRFNVKEKEETLSIPSDAVIRTGARELVFIDLGDGHFEPREVALGMASDDGRVEVLDGVEEGDRVVTQAQFLLDSESRMRDAIARFQGGRS